MCVVLETDFYVSGSGMASLEFLRGGGSGNRVSRWGRCRGEAAVKASEL